MIAANFNIKKGRRELSSLSSKVQKLTNRLNTIDKSGSELESKISKLGKVKLWAKRSVKELKSEVKHVKSIARKCQHRKVNGNGKNQNGNGRHVIKNGNGNGNIKEVENMLIEKKRA